MTSSSGVQEDARGASREVDSLYDRRHTTRSLFVSLLWFVVLVIFVSAFWSRLAMQFPEPLNKIAYAYHPLIGDWWQKHVMQEHTVAERRLVLWVIVSFVLGMFVPAVILRLCGRRFRDAGLGWPNRLGLRLILVSVAVAIPFGLALVYLSRTSESSPIHLDLDLLYAITLLAMIPEHYLICGVCTALMLPGRRLPARVPLAAIEGSRIQRTLRWLGLAQPGVSEHPVGHLRKRRHGASGAVRSSGREKSTPRTPSRVLSWLGLTGTSCFAVVMSGLLFGYVHLGKEYLPEVILSFPGGVAVAYVTLRSHSIWPAILGHWAMNLIPMGLLLLFE